MRIISLTVILDRTLNQPTYPVEIPGNSGNSEMQSFIVDSTGNLAVACLSSDLSYVSTSNTNIVLFWSSTGNSWLWAKQFSGVTNEVLIDMGLRQSDSARLALLYQSSLLIVLNTGTGALVEAHTQPKMACSLGCSLLYQLSSLFLFGVYQDPGQEYFGFNQYSPDSGLPSASISLY